MIKNAQFTDPEKSKFFFPANRETEIHPSVEFGLHPAVVNLDVQYPLLKVEKAGGNTEFRLTRGLFDQEFRIEEGERVQSIEASTRLTAQYLRWYEHPKDKPSDEARQQAARIFGSLTHMILGVDSRRQYYREREEAIENSEFGQEKHAVLPIDSVAPVLSGAKDTYPLEYTIKGFVDNKDRLVTPRTSFASWLVDMCVVNAHVRNKIELLLFEHELGYDRSLAGTLSTQEEVQAYLRYFADKHSGAEKYIPTKEPHNRLYDAEFGDLSEEDRALYDKLITITSWSLSNRREDLDWSFADKDVLGQY